MSIIRNMITEKQKIFFEKIRHIYGKNPLPSYEKIAQEFGFKHKNSVWQYFNKLREEGLIKEDNGRFFINPDHLGAVLFSTPVKAGFPAPAEDYIDKRISLDERFKIDSPSTFLFTVSGDSMVDLGIFESDMVIIKKCLEAKNGDIVLACVDGEFTLKTYRKKNFEVYLEPANQNYPIIKAKDTLTIFGVVTGVVRDIKT